MHSRRLQLSVLCALALVPLALLASLIPSILTSAPTGAQATTHTAVTQVEFGVTVTHESTTTTTTTIATTTPIATQTGGTGVPATPTQTTHPSAVLATNPGTAAAPPPTVAFTGAPIMLEWVLAAVLMTAGAAILGSRRLFGRRGASTRSSAA
jgi:hypothetical protein